MVHPAIETLYDQLAQFPLRIGHEKRAQADLEQHLANSRIPFAREVALNDKDFPDFVIDTEAGAVVVELKFASRERDEKLPTLFSNAGCYPAKVRAFASN